MTRAADQSLDFLRWPGGASSRQVEAGGVAWRVEVSGRGPAALLLHGTGASAHTWRGLAPALAVHLTLIAPDLPGHGGSSPPARPGGYGLPEVARSAAALCGALSARPRYLIGHSAGAAIAVRMALDGLAAPDRIIAINGALLPFPGPLGAWAPLVARGFFYNPIAVAFFKARAEQRGAVRELIESTGSRLDQEGLALYEKLFRRASHLRGTLGLMAHWDLAPLRAGLSRLGSPLTLLVGENDRAVRPETAETLRGLVPKLEILRLPGLGHLAHEEAPERAAAQILRLIGAAGERLKSETG